MILILLILSITILIIIFISNKNYEPFRSYENIKFLTKEKSCQIFLDNHQNYFSKMRYKEVKIRGCINSSKQYSNKVNNCNKHYCSNTMNFNKLEIQNIKYCLGIINKIYSVHFPKMLLLPWKFIKVSDNIEGGMPHTIEECIVLPQNFINYLNILIITRNI